MDQDTTMTFITYVTFGTSHEHKFDNKVFNYHNVAKIRSRNALQGRELAQAYFGTHYCTTYPGEFVNDVWLAKFDNVVPVN